MFLLLFGAVTKMFGSTATKRQIRHARMYILSCTAHRRTYIHTYVSLYAYLDYETLYSAASTTLNACALSPNHLSSNTSCLHKCQSPATYAYFFVACGSFSIRLSYALTYSTQLAPSAVRLPVIWTYRYVYKHHHISLPRFFIIIILSTNCQHISVWLTPVADQTKILLHFMANSKQETN